MTHATALDIIKELAPKFDNYTPIFEYRARMEHLTREQQDQELYKLEQLNKISLSKLAEVTQYSEEQRAAGIPTPVGGDLFFIILEAEEKQQLQTAAATINLNRRAELRSFVLNHYNATNVAELRRVCPEAVKLNLSQKLGWHYLYDLIQSGSSDIKPKQLKTTPTKSNMTIHEYRVIVRREAGFNLVADLKKYFNTPNVDARCKSVWMTWYKKTNQAKADLLAAA